MFYLTVSPMKISARDVSTYPANGNVVGGLCLDPLEAEQAVSRPSINMISETWHHLYAMPARWPGLSRDRPRGRRVRGGGRLTMTVLRISEGGQENHK